MDRKLLVLLVALIAIVGVVNATVFAYRWMTGAVTVAGPDQATGAACTGFYSSADQSNIDLPRVGTNYNAPTYGTNTITVTTGRAVCTWTTDGTEYKLYESIAVTIPVTVGSWYIQDFYGFGYRGVTGDPTVYVWFRVEDDATDHGILATAFLIIRRPDGTEVARLDLRTLGAMTDAIELSPRQGLRLDLYFDAQGTGTVNFRVGVYVSQENEAPAP